MPKLLIYIVMNKYYCIICYFREGFIFANFASQTPREKLEFMSIKLIHQKNLEINHRELPQSKNAK